MTTFYYKIEKGREREGKGGKGREREGKGGKGRKR
jgi:hypothetical protein